MNFIEEKILEKGNLDKLCFRFPPEPNGSKVFAKIEEKEIIKYTSGLHLGHCKSICLNFGLAEKYNAPCILRFDDTNPETEEEEYVNSMIKDIEWLGFKPSRITHTSDYFENIYNYAVDLIKKSLAYVDDSSSDEIAEMKGTPTIPGKNSSSRSNSIEKNISLFERMKNGEFEEGSMTLRSKIDMASPNMILRDPVIYRIINKPHHRTKDIWKIYPMYDFAHPISDYIENISDSLCTLEFEVHRPLYNWILENLDLPNRLPEESEFARLNVDYTIMSKRNLKMLVENGYVAGFDDPRMPTISGLRRRGYTPESLKNFCESVGVTKRESVISHLLLEECLRVDLNKRSRRFMGVMDPIKLTITNWNKGVEYVEIENNPEDASSGKRMVPFSGELYIDREDFREFPENNKYHRLKLGGEVRLKGAYVVKAYETIKKGGEIIEVKCTYDPLTKSGMEMDRKIKGTIHWVSRPHGINVEVREYANLFTVSNPGDVDNLMDCVNKDSLSVINAVFEPSIKDCKIGLPIQIIRAGYYVMDPESTNDKLIFNKSVSLKEGFKI